MRIFPLALAAVLFVVSSARAQTSSDTIITMTVPLKHLSAKDAVQLLQPFVTSPVYANSPGGGVFPLPGGTAITIREKVSNYGRMLQLLREYDRSAATVAFTFQLIIADNSGKRDPDIASLDTVLRSVLRYTGYRLVGVGVMRSGESSFARETITADDQKFTLLMSVADIRTSGADASVKLNVSLQRDKGMMISDNQVHEEMLSTGVTVPIGQTVVLGSASLDAKRAIILTVRPQLVGPASTGKED
jgi:hypothetical protein